VYPDPASKQRKTSAGGRTDLSILTNAGFIPKVMSRHMAIRDRVNSVNAKLCSASGQRGIIIHPKCKNLLNSIAKQTYKEGTVLPDKTQGFDHMNDALGYLISFLYPITTYYNNEPVERFTVKTGNLI
jgi:phage terminase large subunit